METTQTIVERWPFAFPASADGKALLNSLLLEWRIEDPLSPGFTLRLGDQYFGDPTCPVMTSFLLGSGRTASTHPADTLLPVDDIPRAWRPRPRPRPRAFALACKEVTIVAALPGSTGWDNNSQVYLGTLCPPAADTAVDVIIKLYQASHMSIFNWPPLESLPEGEVPDEFNVMQNFELEIWAYDRLAHLQGSVVPHVYGFFRVVMPYGEPCIALILEHIPCINHRKFVAECKKVQSDTIYTLGDNLSNAVRSLHAAGIYQDDLTSGNVLLPVDTPELPVLIDFAWISRVEEANLIYAAKQIIDVLICAGFSERRVLKWATYKILMDESWVAAFDIPARDWDYVRKNVFGEWGS